MEKEVLILIMPWLITVVIFLPIQVYGSSKKNMIKIEDVKPMNPSEHFWIKKANGARYESFGYMTLGFFGFGSCVAVMYVDGAGYIEEVKEFTFGGFVFILLFLGCMVQLLYNIVSIINLKKVVLEIRSREIRIYEKEKLVQILSIADISSVVFHPKYRGARSPANRYLMVFDIFDKSNKKIIKGYPINVPDFQQLSSYLRRYNCYVIETVKKTDRSYKE